MFKKLAKCILIKLYHGNTFFRKGVTFGKKAYIREHTKILGGRYIIIGDNSRISLYSRIECYEGGGGGRMDPALRIGSNVSMGRDTTILCCDEINIGDNCLFGSYCTIMDLNHGFNPSLGVRYECQKIKTEPVNIGKNCWIGEKAIILPGVSIGDNAVIGAGSIVTKDIPANSIAVGNPARIIKRYDFAEEKWK